MVAQDLLKPSKGTNQNAGNIRHTAHNMRGAKHSHTVHTVHKSDMRDEVRKRHHKSCQSIN